MRLGHQQSSHQSAEASTSSPHTESPANRSPTTKGRAANSPASANGASSDLPRVAVPPASLKPLPELTPEMKESMRKYYSSVNLALDVESPQFQELYDRERQASTVTQGLSSKRADPGQSGAAPGQSGTAPGQSGIAPGQSGTAPGHSGAAPRSAESSSEKSEPEVEEEFLVRKGALTKEELDKVRNALQANMVLQAPTPQHMGPQYKVRPSSRHVMATGSIVCWFLVRSKDELPHQHQSFVSLRCLNK